MNSKMYNCKACRDSGYVYGAFGLIECASCSSTNHPGAAQSAGSVAGNSGALPNHQWTPAKVERLLKIVFGIGIAAFFWVLYRYSSRSPTAPKDALAQATAAPLAPAEFSPWEPEA